MIGICIATYNQEQFIAQAIESALSQLCDEPIRIYIGDDCSTDTTTSICERYKEKDDRIVLVRREKNIGSLTSQSRSGVYKAQRIKYKGKKSLSQYLSLIILYLGNCL